MQNITVRMEGTRCHVSQDGDAWLQTHVSVNSVKVATLTQPTKENAEERRSSGKPAPRHGPESNTCLLNVKLRDRLRIDAYDEEGAAQLLSIEYTVTEKGLILEHENDGGHGVQVIIEHRRTPGSFLS